MMAFREYDDEILRNYFDIIVMDVVRALLSETDCQYERDQPTKPDMYKIEEAFNNLLDDFVVEMVSADVALDELLQVKSCTSSVPMREGPHSRLPAMQQWPQNT